MEQKTVVWLAEIARAAGFRVVRFNFLYRALGRGMPDRMPILVSTYRSVILSVRDRLAPETLIIGGHSMGGRTASMLEAESKTADGLVLFGYPLHPAGQPDKLRVDHLRQIEVPVLQLSGTEDPLCTKDLMDSAHSNLQGKDWRLHWISGADHSYGVKRAFGRTRADVQAEIQSALSRWREDHSYR